MATTFIFGPYFISRMVLDANGNLDPVVGQAAWGYAIAIGGFVIAVLAPILGSIADQSGPRKSWIAAFVVLKIGGLLYLWNAAPDSSVFWVLLACTVAAVTAEFSIVFNDSMLSGLVKNEKIGEISNTAYVLGYLGCMVVLIIVLTLLAGSATTAKTLIGIEPLFGFSQAQCEDARETGPLSALWYFVFILPIFLFTPDQGKQRPMGESVRLGLAEMRQTMSELRRQSGLLRFFSARMIYQVGIGALLGK